MTSIHAAVLREPGGAFRFESLRLDGPRPDEVLVRIVACGICHTDLAARDQHLAVPLPAVLGHEGAGVVEAVGTAVTRLQPGDHVVLSYDYCGQCTNCRRAQYTCCGHMRPLNFGGGRLGGGSPYSDGEGETVSGLFFGQSSFASHALAHERNAHKVPRDAPLELMAALGCGVQTGAGTVLNSLKPLPGSSLAVFGAGSVGLSAVMAARLSGCTEIIAVDLNEDRLALARELGATLTLNPKHADVVQEILRVTGDGVQYAVECTGVPAVVNQAVQALRCTGTCAMVGAGPAGAELKLPMRMLSTGRTVRGVLMGDAISAEFIPTLVRLWQEGRFPFDRLVTRFPMASINEAVAAMEAGTVVKPLLCNG